MHLTFLCLCQHETGMKWPTEYFSRLLWRLQEIISWCSLWIWPFLFECWPVKLGVASDPSIINNNACCFTFHSFLNVSYLNNKGDQEEEILSPLYTWVNWGLEIVNSWCLHVQRNKSIILIFLFCFGWGRAILGDIQQSLLALYQC